jgi:hypothetical protein
VCIGDADHFDGRFVSGDFIGCSTEVEEQVVHDGDEEGEGTLKQGLND